MCISSTAILRPSHPLWIAIFCSILNFFKLLTSLSLFSSALTLPATSGHDHHALHAHHSRNVLPRNGAGSAITVSAALDFYDPTFSDGAPMYSDPTEYQCFSGPASNFPAHSQWSSFWDLFNLNQKTSMAPIGDTGAEQGAMYDAIVTVSQQSKVDARIILAIIVQEVRNIPRSGSPNNSVRGNTKLNISYSPLPTSASAAPITVSKTAD